MRGKCTGNRAKFDAVNVIVGSRKSLVGSQYPMIPFLAFYFKGEKELKCRVFENAEWNSCSTSVINLFSSTGRK